MAYDLKTEIREAIVAGEEALVSLREAKRYLSSAGNWGLWDIFSRRSMIVTFVKHTKINKAISCIDVAKNDLRRFREELDEVDDYLPNVRIGEFMTFADFFFDGFVADVMMQTKISNAKSQVDDAIYQVESIVNRLRREI